MSLNGIHLLDGWLPDLVFSLIALALTAVLVMRPARSATKVNANDTARRSGRRIAQHRAWHPRLVRWRYGFINHSGPKRLAEFAIAVLGTALGWLIIWLVSDVFMVFGVSVGWKVMLCVAVTFGVVSLLVSAVIGSHARRRIVAAVLIPLTVLGSAMEINIIYGEYATLASLLGRPQYQQFRYDLLAHNTISVTAWLRLVAAGGLPSVPSHGVTGTVDIPATISGFTARRAALYVPPAALSRTPPALPVMIMLSGQPGSPEQLFSSSRIASMLDAYAARHHGLAPIVVSPDQNGAATHNSLCSDTHVYGNAETYVTADVTNWVKRHLPVAQSARMWLIGGFSQGGTCSTQLGPAHPDVYGHIFAVDGELEPTDRNRAYTIKRYFNSNTMRYMAHVPTQIIATHAPSTQTLFSAAGSWDKQSQRNQHAIAKAALRAGMQVTTVITSNSGHDWHAVQAALVPLIDRFGDETGLGKTGNALTSYPNIRMTAANGSAARVGTQTGSDIVAHTLPNAAIRTVAGTTTRNTAAATTGIPIGKRGVRA